MAEVKQVNEFCECEVINDIVNYINYQQQLHLKELHKEIDKQHKNSFAVEYHEKMYRAYAKILYQVNHFKF